MTRPRSLVVRVNVFSQVCSWAEGGSMLRSEKEVQGHLEAALAGPQEDQLFLCHVCYGQLLVLIRRGFRSYLPKDTKATSTTLGTGAAPIVCSQKVIPDLTSMIHPVRDSILRDHLKHADIVRTLLLFPTDLIA